MKQVATIQGLEDYTRTCARCGKRFIGKHTAVYCSGACRTADYRERRRAAAAGQEQP